MASLLSALTSLRSYHLIAWGSLLGMQLYQTFVMTKLCYLSVPRPQFMKLQSRVFPTYFAAETVLALSTAATYPAGSMAGLLSRPLDLGLLGATLGMSGLNYFVYGPKSTGAMNKRTEIEARDGLHPGTSASMAREKISEDLYKAKRVFSVNHAMSIHLNLIGVITSLLYGLSLSARLTE